MWWMKNFNQEIFSDLKENKMDRVSQWGQRGIDDEKNVLLGKAAGKPDQQVENMNEAKNRKP